GGAERTGEGHLRGQPGLVAFSARRGPLRGGKAGADMAGFRPDGEVAAPDDGRRRRPFDVAGDLGGGPGPGWRGGGPGGGGGGGGRARRVGVGEVEPGQLRALLSGHGREVRDGAFTRDGQTLISAAAPVKFLPHWVKGGEVKLWTTRRTESGDLYEPLERDFH